MMAAFDGPDCNHNPIFSVEYEVLELRQENAALRREVERLTRCGGGIMTFDEWCNDKCYMLDEKAAAEEAWDHQQDRIDKLWDLVAKQDSEIEVLEARVAELEKAAMDFVKLYAAVMGDKKYWPNTLRELAALLPPAAEGENKPAENGWTWEERRRQESLKRRGRDEATPASP